MHTNASLIRIIARALDQGRQDGLDQLGQHERAVKSVLMVEPDLSEGTARKLVAELAAC